ncbi:hypothetical protein [Agrobacterium salinitolerans]|uniref:hypothetical protein n=1 Tax=Agrobacterium salinitolerans TaxID=1183413 RepID=UPI0022B84552|nr:hypothetical protein [Agrobacterium salinitolerans]MCZ7886021.1 hypothetical protein [Agrobacterium salinitolerans]
MKTFVVDVTQRITVRIDETKFTEEVMEGFNLCITDFGTDESAFEEHAKHIASLAASGTDFEPHYFVEGYGYARNAGIDVTVHNDLDADVVEKGGAA